MRGKREAGDNASTRAAVQLLDLVPGAPHLAEHGTGTAHECLAHRREDHAARAPLEQRNAELALKLMNAARERRLGKREVARSCAQAAALGDCNYIAQPGELPCGLIEKPDRSDNYDIFLRSLSRASALRREYRVEEARRVEEERGELARMNSQAERTQVLVVGAGPVGLSLAIELGLRGVAVTLVEQRSRTGAQPR